MKNNSHLTTVRLELFFTFLLELYSELGFLIYEVTRYNEVMIKWQLFKHTLSVLFALTVLELLANVFYLHWTVWWFDVILHFLGGASVSMTAVLILHYQLNQTISQFKLILIGVIGALVIGFLWEVYEVLAGDTFLSDGISYWRDTSSDLIMDICGGFFATLYSFRILNSRINS